MPTEKIAFRMFLNPGCEAEYQRRHDAIWPELCALLKECGISDYSIFLDAPRGVLFAVMRCGDGVGVVGGGGLDSLPQHPVMQRWWQHMKDLMQTNADGSPVTESLPRVFHLE